MSRPGLRLRRLGAGRYEVVDRGAVVGQVVRDGEPGRDDYPWTWLMAGLSKGVRGTGVSATMRSAVDEVRARWRPS